jgi:hypothetical protein
LGCSRRRCPSGRRRGGSGNVLLEDCIGALAHTFLLCSTHNYLVRRCADATMIRSAGMDRTRGSGGQRCSHSQHRPCPKLTLSLPPPPPTFNRSLMPPWSRMRGRQKTSFSLIPLPPSYSPATHPPPLYLSFKT